MRTAVVAGLIALVWTSSATAQSVQLRSATGDTVVLSAEQIAALPRETVSLTAHGETHSYEGPSLSRILAQAGAAQGQALRGPALLGYVVVRAADGYAVVLSLAETDPAMRAQRIILADRVDGGPIDAEHGPLRLVVEGDARPARSVRQVTAIELHQAH